jgi:hypothetical protein
MTLSDKAEIICPTWSGEDWTRVRRLYMAIFEGNKPDVHIGG